MSEKKYVEIEPELVQRAQNGDSAAFIELYQKGGPIIYRTVYSMVWDEDLAWDVHRNAYLLAWQNLSDLGNPQLFLPWLRKIAVREAIRELKKDQPLCFSELANEEDEEPQFVETREDYQPELQIGKQEAARLVREILGQMPQKQKLHGLHGLCRPLDPGQRRGNRRSGLWLSQPQWRKMGELCSLRLREQRGGALRRQERPAL